MIKEHQPTVFGSNLRVGFSSASDGSMRSPAREPEAAEVMERYLPEAGFSPVGTVGMLISYGPERTYDTVRVVDEKSAKQGVLNPDEWIEADALITDRPGVAILLPVADCVATVVHDPVKNILGVLHLGRHSSVSHLIEAFHGVAAEKYGSSAADWRVWMSPSLQKQSNVLEYFTPDSPEEWDGFVTKREDGKLLVDIPAHNKRRFKLLGVKPENIEVSPIDTHGDTRYYSHRAAVELNQPERDGRMVVVARMAGPGELAD